MPSHEANAARRVAANYASAGTTHGDLISDAFEAYADALDALEAEAREAFEADVATRNSHWSPHGPPDRDTR